MTDGLENLPERVDALEQKVDGLSTAVDRQFNQIGQRFDGVDRRFDEVDAAVVEQRLYTEFAYERLDSKMDAGFTRLDSKMDAGFARLERKLDQFIDTQSKTNELVERRLRLWEPPLPLGSEEPAV